MTTENDQGALAPMDDAALFDAIAAGETGPTEGVEEVLPPSSPTEGAPAEGTAPQADPQPQDHRVPLSELLDTRDRAKRAEQQVADLLKQIEAGKPKESTDFFDNPQAAIEAATAPALQSLHSAMLHNARLVAGTVHGDETVDQAESAFIEALNSGQIDRAEVQRLVNSPNRYVAAVEWHRRQAVLKEVGSDPNAYRQQVLDQALKDPAFLAKALESARAQAQPTPVVSLPGSQKPTLPSVSKMGAADPIGQTQQDTADDDSLWNEITAPRRRA